MAKKQQSATMLEHLRKKMTIAAFYHLVTTQHPQGMSSYLTVLRQQV